MLNTAPYWRYATTTDPVAILEVDGQKPLEGEQKPLPLEEGCPLQNIAGRVRVCYSRLLEPSEENFPFPSSGCLYNNRNWMDQMA